jgi:signal transduction histidine kinase
MSLRSFRLRLLLGSILWTSGLLFFAHYFSVFVFRHFDRVQWGSFHGAPYVRVLTVISLACIAVGLWQVRKALSVFDALRARLSAVREGRDQRLEGRYPSEVQPLVDELNDLLEHRERIVKRALAKAGDLAHGLKTPLAVLAHEAEGSPSIEQQIVRMRRQIEYHLAHARAAASGATLGAHCVVRESAEGLARTLHRLYAERGIDICVEVSEEHAVRAQREDLDEMLGNLLDNACKWARSRVTIASRQDGDRIVITVDDDGPGLEPSLRESVLQRGVRADEAAPGSGLGLAIVRDLAELYGGHIMIETSPDHGLRALLELSQ